MGRRLASLMTIGLLAAASAPLLLASPAAAATFPSGFTDTTVAGSLGQATGSGPAARWPLPGHRSGRHAAGGERVVGGGGHRPGRHGRRHLTRRCARPPRWACSASPSIRSSPPTASCTSTTPAPSAARAPCRGRRAGGAVNRVSRFTMAGNTIARDTESVVLDNMPEWGGNHNGGYVHIAHDGTMFVSVGDGGAGRPDGNSANLSLPNGKILRVNTDGTIPRREPQRHDPVRHGLGDAERDVRRDLRRRAAQPVPPGVQGRRPRRLVPHQRRRRRHLGRGRRRHGRRALRLAVPGGA